MTVTTGIEPKLFDHLGLVSLALINDDDVPPDRTARTHDDAVHVGTFLIAATHGLTGFGSDFTAAFGILNDEIDVSVGFAQLIVGGNAIVGKFRNVIIQVVG